ncbi:hypothetical protein CEUSTIGMA_g13026.t1 [Chlamydomonas eustigma]|uniref:CID domain-containing protein n=1 Tax=Chlamydomonas eustigma TaxID=1157962 RepID=A0A250XR98_9CHLO|nr:hypothetical protein CEUSTIGMA_g13026.t1 [Chlamydomonas eustigma]|eukprot:GAX85611.1 hypothetical protein CEUSTIGMA_g13026.t1 [Chlamydomonas eustigma]
METGFKQVLEGLSGSKESIKSSQQWFTACQPVQQYAPGLVALMARRLINLVEYEKQLHIIYLANDILFKAQQSRQSGTHFSVDSVASAFLPVLGPMMAAAYLRGGKSEEVRVKLAKILSFWSERGVYDSAATTSLEQSLTSVTDPSGALEQALASSTSAALSQPVAKHAASAPWQQATVPGPQPPQTATPWQQQQPQHSAALPPNSAPWQQHLPTQSAMPPPGSPAPWQQQAPQAQGAPAPSAAPWQQAPQLQQQHSQQSPWQQGPPMPHPHLAHQFPPGQAPVMGIQHSNMPPWGAPNHAPQPPFQSVQQQIMPPGAAVMQHQQVGWTGAVGPLVTSHYQHGPPHSGTNSIIMTAAPPPDVKPSEASITPIPSAGPVSSFSFPPGLLPRLCRDKERHSRAYTPLDQRDIEREGLPEPPEKDAYLLSRIDRFYAEIKDYRPGSIRSDMDDEDRERRSRDTERDDDRSGRGPRGSGRRSDGRPGGMREDGSFEGGASSSHYAGLGVNTLHRDEDSNDSYSSYRTMRSSSYHDMIAKGDSFSNVARGGR